MKTTYPTRTVTINDIDELRNLFRSTIQAVNIQNYTPAEIEDWASCGDCTIHWKNLLSTLYFLAALDNEGRIIGFASIRADGYLHSMFVHKDWQRKGIASQLLSEIEAYACRFGITQITSEVSITARPFFEKQGYSVEKSQKKRAKRLEMINYVMKKEL